MIRLSVIVPVFNVEDYIASCLDSVVEQNIDGLEVIVVDDGSQDASGQIAASYSERYPWIRVYEKENGGLSDARNYGLRQAQGQYVAFLDSDDYVEPGAYEKLLKKAEETDADIVFCMAKYYNETTGLEEEVNDQSALPLLENLGEIFSLRDLPAAGIFSYQSFLVAWNKIIRRDLLVSHEIMFPVGHVFEDNVFYYKTLLVAGRMAQIRERLIVYRINRKGSIVNNLKMSGLRGWDMLPIMREIDGFIKKRGLAPQFGREFCRFAATELNHKYEIIPDYLKGDFLQELAGIVSSRTFYESAPEKKMRNVRVLGVPLLTYRRTKWTRTLRLLKVVSLASVMRTVEVHRGYHFVLKVDRNVPYGLPRIKPVSLPQRLPDDRVAEHGCLKVVFESIKNTVLPRSRVLLVVYASLSRDELEALDAMFPPGGQEAVDILHIDPCLDQGARLAMSGNIRTLSVPKEHSSLDLTTYQRIFDELSRIYCAANFECLEVRLLGVTVFRKKVLCQV